jgi:hypothetical protein
MPTIFAFIYFSCTHSIIIQKTNYHLQTECKRIANENANENAPFSSITKFWSSKIKHTKGTKEKLPMLWHEAFTSGA